MSIKVGDRVRILDGRKILDGRNNPNIHPKWVDGMDELIGEIRTVKHINGIGDYSLEGISYFFAEEWLAPAEFTKADLKEFDIVEFRNGRQALITMNIAMGVLEADGFSFRTWNDDLKDNTGADIYDIMKVYRPTDNIPTDKSKWKDLPVVYEEVKEMTVEEISKALGYEVKVVK